MNEPRDNHAPSPGIPPLREVQADEWGGFLFLRLAAGDGPGVVESLGEIPGRVRRYPLDALVIGKTLAYEVRANYKVVLENYNECYHCAGVHPELVRLVPAFGRGGADLDCGWLPGVQFGERCTTTRSWPPATDI